MLPPIFTILQSSFDVRSIIGDTPRAYRHGEAPQNTTKPYVTWGMVTGTPENELSDVPSVDKITLQVDCWHQTDSGVEELARAVRDAIEPYAYMTGMPVNLRETETKLYRIGLQFDYWQSRAN